MGSCGSREIGPQQLGHAQSDSAHKQIGPAPSAPSPAHFSQGSGSQVLESHGASKVGPLQTGSAHNQVGPAPLAPSPAHREPPEAPPGVEKLPTPAVSLNETMSETTFSTPPPPPPQPKKSKKRPRGETPPPPPKCLFKSTMKEVASSSSQEAPPPKSNVKMTLLMTPRTLGPAHQLSHAFRKLGHAHKQKEAAQKEPEPEAVSEESDQEGSAPEKIGHAHNGTGSAHSQPDPASLYRRSSAYQEMGPHQEGPAPYPKKSRQASPAPWSQAPPPWNQAPPTGRWDLIPKGVDPLGSQGTQNVGHQLIGHAHLGSALLDQTSHAPLAPSSALSVPNSAPSNQQGSPSNQENSAPSDDPSSAPIQPGIKIKAECMSPEPEGPSQQYLDCEKVVVEGLKATVPHSMYCQIRDGGGVAQQIEEQMEMYNGRLENMRRWMEHPPDPYRTRCVLCQCVEHDADDCPVVTGIQERVRILRQHNYCTRCSRFHLGACHTKLACRICLKAGAEGYMIPETDHCPMMCPRQQEYYEAVKIYGALLQAKNQLMEAAQAQY
uniref:TAZ-type domain-containing protein n=1 Tax=Caenorhabditis tropicalis TaxID=1561998 RepID=A0A1I7UJ77_9PELO